MQLSTYIPYTHFIYLLQICDFGLAKWKQQAGTQTTTVKRSGTVAYMAPEVFEDASCSRTVKYDVYSFGILLWELLSSQKPFKDGALYCAFGINKITYTDMNVVMHGNTYALP